VTATGRIGIAQSFLQGGQRVGVVGNTQSMPWRSTTAFGRQPVGVDIIERSRPT
jgi:hypothetical protein